MPKTSNKIPRNDSVTAAVAKPGSDQSGRALLTRHPDNPILTAAHWPYEVNAVFNPGAVRLPNGETLLLCRVEDCAGHSHFSVARSDNGVTDWRIDPEPTLVPDSTTSPTEEWGIEDPRIVWLEELDRYAVVYTGYGRHGPSVSLALTEDFKTFERLGQVLPPEDKDAALLPHRVTGRWAMIHRPVPNVDGKHIWMSFSDDLQHWGKRTLVLKARRGGWWDATKIGLSTPLIETPEGWLMVYHGVRSTVSGSVYRIGLALLDADDPTRCLLRGTEWILGPQTDYERIGDVPNIVFANGYTIDDDRDTVRFYYGAADTSLALATGSIRAMVDWLVSHSVPVDFGTA